MFVFYLLGVGLPCHSIFYQFWLCEEAQCVYLRRHLPISRTLMFVAAQFIIAKCWKQPKCPSVNEWIKKQWYIYTMEYYAAERKELLPFTTAWMELESITLSEISQAVKDKHRMISPVSGT